MSVHQPFSVARILPASSTTSGAQSLFDYFEKTPAQLTDNLDDAKAALVIGSVSADCWQQLSKFAQAGGTLFFINDPDQQDGIPQKLFGGMPCEPYSECEVRVLPTKADNPLVNRLGDAFYMTGRFQPIDVQDDSVETVFYADWRYTHQAMITRKAVGEGQAIMCTLHDYENEAFQRIVYRMLHEAAAPQISKTLGVGLLGYAPSVGQLHGSGAAATYGLRLAMACDLSDERLAAAKEHFPDIITTKDSNDLITSDDVDIVIIATAPNSHARLAMQMLEAGKHVICEKPLALTKEETDGMMRLAAEKRLHVSCHQNRRWDSDFLAIQNAVNAGWLGDVFYLETFIGGYGHPCGYWHSHDVVSGGTTFDWGAHYLDWMLALIPEKIVGVMGTRQNRSWHDVTNADHERIFLRYANGAEAEFTHSDLVFIPKPKWFMSGDKGTIVGHWKEHTAYEIDPVVYYHKHEIPPAELGANIELKRKTSAGIFTQALPEVTHQPFPFHSNLADYLLLGEPITVPVSHSARVVEILEAAKISAENGGALQDVEI
ncbi:MAG: Gfo/Idh/MocA family oxidoreductase [Chloroflexota bacterium]